jgi:hypothetical protein
VPMGNPGGEKTAPLFDVYVQQGASPWRRITENNRYSAYHSPPSESQARSRAEDSRRSQLQGRQDGPPTDRPWVTLQPGEDCIAVVTGYDAKDSGEAKNLKAVLRQSDAGVPGRWSGAIETPSLPTGLSEEQYRTLQAASPFPSHFPPLSHDYSGTISRSPDASLVELLHGPNQPLIDMLRLYEPSGVCREFERRMRAEKVIPMKLLLASIAAPTGSEDAARFLLETMKDTDYSTVVDLHYALWIACWNYANTPMSRQESEPPDWLVELLLTVLSDNRFVTGLEKANWAEGTSFKVSSCETGALVSTLGETKFCKAVPLLLDLAKKRCGDWELAIMALGEIGDRRVIPALIELLKTTGTKIQYTKDGGFDGDDDTRAFAATAFALRKLKAREAVSLLLKYVEYPEIIGCLGDIGDQHAVPALRELVAAKGRIVQNGKPLSPELESKRTFDAKLALARLDDKNGCARLGEMLSDRSLEPTQRREVLHWLVLRAAPQAIPALVELVKTSSDHYAISEAILSLSEFKYKEAVEGLIECFDVKFKSEDVDKGERVTPATYCNQIARSLQTITGQPFGADKQQWIRWWREKGQQDATLK